MGSELDVADFLATSAQYAADKAAFAQMDAAAMQMGGPSVADFAGFQQGQAVEDFMAFQQMQRRGKRELVLVEYNTTFMSRGIAVQDALWF